MIIHLVDQDQPPHRVFPPPSLPAPRSDIQFANSQMDQAPTYYLHKVVITAYLDATKQFVVGEHSSVIVENGTTIVVAVPLTVVLRRRGRKTPDATTVSMSSVICIQFELEALSLDHLSGRLECLRRSSCLRQCIIIFERLRLFISFQLYELTKLSHTFPTS